MAGTLVKFNSEQNRQSSDFTKAIHGGWLGKLNLLTCEKHFDQCLARGECSVCVCHPEAGPGSLPVRSAATLLRLGPEFASKVPQSSVIL